MLSGVFPAVLAPRYVVPISCYFYVLTAVFHFGLMRTSEGKPAVFIRYYMAATTLKLFLHLGVLVVFAVLNSTAVIPFVLTFVVNYAFFTVFEVAVAYRFSRTERKV